MLLLASHPLLNNLLNFAQALGNYSINLQEEISSDIENSDHNRKEILEKIGFTAGLELFLINLTAFIDPDRVNDHIVEAINRTDDVDIEKFDSAKEVYESQELFSSSKSVILEWWHESVNFPTNTANIRRQAENFLGSLSEEEKNYVITGTITTFGEWINCITLDDLEVCRAPQLQAQIKPPSLIFRGLG